MKAIMKKLFSFSLSETVQFDEKQDIIELVNCPLKEMMCRMHLTKINNWYLESEQHRIEKNFNDSIDSLKVAFDAATELMDHPCNKCAQSFRHSIIKTLTHIQDELKEMSKGIFGNKIYHMNYLKAGEVLTDFKNAKYCNSIQLNESKERFLGNFLN